MSSGDLALPGELTFVDGLVGLPDLRRFAVAPYDETLFFALDSLDDRTFGVLAAMADHVREGMTHALVEAGHAPEGAQVLVLLSVHGDPPAVTANLAGPIVVDPATAAATQIVVEGDAYPLRAPLTTTG